MKKYSRVNSNNDYQVGALLLRSVMNKMFLVLGFALGFFSPAVRADASPCGMDQKTVADKAQNCLSKLGSTAKMALTDDQIKKTYLWSLISQDSKGQQLWQDDTTELVWTGVNQENLNQKDTENFCSDVDRGQGVKLGRDLNFHLPKYEQLRVATHHGLGQLQPSLSRDFIWTAEVIEKNGFTTGVAWFLQSSGFSGNAVFTKSERNHSFGCVASP